MQVKPYFSEVSEFIEILKQQDFDYKNTPASNPAVVSIISSFYNVPREYFLEANRSIQNQTFQNYEWIIADDCSTDEKAIALFGELTQLNPKIKTVRRSVNGGLAAGRNTAIAYAKGKYLFFMDTDDLLEPTMIEKCVLFLETHADFSFVNTYSVGFGEQEYWWSKGFDKPSEFINENRVTGRLLYRKEDFDAVGGFDEGLRFYEDWERWLKAISHGQRGWTIPEYLDCYRRTNTGLLATSRNKVSKEQQVTSLIPARYQSFFETHSPSKTIVERPMFDLLALRQKLTLQNPLNMEEEIEGKRILCWFPHLEVGGADKFNIDLLTGLKRLGYCITIVTTVAAEHQWFNEFYKITADIFHLPRLLHYGHWLTFSRYLIESRHIDVCFLSNAYYAYYLLPFLRSDFPGVAFVDYTHTDDPDWRKGGYPRVSCQFNDFLDRQVVSSNRLAGQFIQLNPATAAKLEVCYINVDERLWKSDLRLRERTRRRMSVSDEETILLFPARMTEQKRPLFFLDIVQRLVDLENPIRALMIGGGSLKELVNRRVDSAGLGDVVQLLSFVSAKEMLAYYSAADVVLLPSAYEGISLVLYEAMAMGLPVVASAVGGQQELLAPTTGFLVPVGNADEDECIQYTQILEPLLNSRKLRQQVGKAARNRIESCFRLDSMVERMTSIFSKARHRQHSEEFLFSPSTFSPSMAEEMLIWIQEFLALDQNWDESQRLRQALVVSEQWARDLLKERDLYKAQSEAWQRVAQKNQKLVHSRTGK